MIVDGKKVEFLYVVYTRDELELPIAVADSVYELAEMLGLETHRVREYLSRSKAGKAHQNFKVIDVREDTDVPDPEHDLLKVGRTKLRYSDYPNLTRQEVEDLTKKYVKIKRNKK